MMVTPVAKLPIALRNSVALGLMIRTAHSADADLLMLIPLMYDSMHQPA
jgi:hypothetical protein